MEAQFRIGGFYRNGYGEVCQIVGLHPEAQVDSEVELSRDGEKLLSIFCLASGRVSGTGYYKELNLLPGELTLKDGQWVAVEEGDGFAIAGADATLEQVMDAIADMHISVASNAAMIDRDYTDAAWAYAKDREQVRQVAQMLAGSLPSTAKPSIAGLTRVGGFSHLLGAGIR